MRLAAMLVALPLLAGCVTVGANADSDREVDFAVYRTFAMEPAPSRGPPDMPGYSEIAGARIVKQIRDALIESGLVEDEIEPDLRVVFHLSGAERTNQARWEESDRSFGWSDQQRYAYSDTIHYVEGLLVIDMYDTRRERIVWHGWATADVYAHSDGLRLATRAVEDLMALYPPEPVSD